MHILSPGCGKYGPEHVKYVDFSLLNITVDQGYFQLAKNSVFFKRIATTSG
jgi:hypothetical protein